MLQPSRKYQLSASLPLVLTPELTLPMAAVRYPALLAMVARLVSLLGSPALPAAEMITGGVLASPDTVRGIIQRNSPRFPKDISVL